jgi:membrane protease YdiL (CAAX protease family)
MRKQVDESAATAQRRTAVGEFLVNVLFLLCGYTLVLSALPLFSEQLPWDAALLSFPLQVVFGIGAWRFIRATGYPLRDFGIGTRHAVGSLLESIVFTVPLLGAVTGIKWALLQTSAAFATAPLIEHVDVAARLQDPHVQTWICIYAFSCLVQELIVRGALQASLEMFLIGEGRIWRAVVVSALIFAVNHLHLSFAFALAAFLPGLYWGWLFARRRNLLGPTLSHIVVGSYVFFILGAPLPV